MRDLILSTRPSILSAGTVRALYQQDYDVLNAPMLDIVPLDDPAPEIQNQLIMITSQISLLMLETRRQDISAWLDHPCYCVGPKTAQAAKDFGFTDVHEGRGGGAELAESIIRHKKKSVLHIGAAQTDQNAFDILNSQGFSVEYWALYRAEPVAALSPTLLSGLQAEKIHAALFFSARTGQTFSKLVHAAGLEESCASMHTVAISDTVAHAVDDLPWRGIKIAKRPTLESVVATLTDNMTDF